MTPMRTERLMLRNWEERDRELFLRINSDERVMEFFPFRRNRAASDALLDRLRAGIAERGYGFSPVEIVATGECVGFVGLNPVCIEPAIRSGSTEVGWRLAPEFWGFGYATEAAEAWLAFGFEKLGLTEILSFAVWNNDRSISVMRRLGMRYERDFEHPDIPSTHRHLRLHSLFTLARQDWSARAAARK